MPHLSADRLAALADAGSSPAPLEAGHLANCDQCAAELRAYGILVSDARHERGAIAAPLTNWAGIAAGLRAEGLLATASAVGRRPGTASAVDRRPSAVPAQTRWLQVAAAVMVLAGGVAAGRLSAIAGPFAVANESVVTADGRRSTADAVGSSDALPDSTDGTPDDYRTRLVALDRAGRTMREAMEAAPYDPVLTGYYLTTLGQREATLRQLNVAVPAGARLNSF